MGCSSSKVGTSHMISVDQIKSLPTEETTSTPIRFLENCRIIWTTDQTSNKFKNEQEQLQKRFYGLHIFNNIDACIAFISTIQDEKLFLIISDTSKSIERFQYLPQIEKIYIFTTSSFERNNIENRKLLNYDIIENIDQLSKQLQHDIKLCEMDFILLTVVPASLEEILFSSSLAKQEASFLFTQIVKEIIYRMKFERGSKDVFIDFCRAHYVSSSEQLSIIDNFAKNYRPNKALYWLTKQCFISQMSNRVLRTREIDIIYKLRFFIKQVNLQLNHLHEENALKMKNIGVIYRGKTITNDEFDILLKDKCGGLVSFPSFLMATIDKEMAIDFIHHRLALYPDRIGIIFEIYIDQTIFSEKSPFALLKGMDMDKDEICFYISSVFRIETVEKSMNDGRVIWVVKLKLINDDEPQLLRLTVSIRNDEMHTNMGPYLSKLLIDMGEYSRAEQIFLGLLKDPSALSEPRRLARVYNGLGSVYTYKNEHAKALYYYQQLLQTSLTYRQSDHPELAPIYKSIGNTYLKQNDYIHAIENYEKAVELLKYGKQQANSEFVTDLHTRINEVRQSL